MLRHLFGGSAAHHPGALPADAMDWSALGDLASYYISPAPGASCMLGALDVHTKARTVAQRRQRSNQVGVLETAKELEKEALDGEQHKQVRACGTVVQSSGLRCSVSRFDCA